MTESRDRHSGVWIVAEQREGKVRSVSYELLNWGRGLADGREAPLSALLFGHALDGEEVFSLIRRGADRVYLVDDPAFEHFLAEPCGRALTWLIERFRPEIVLAAATTTGRTIMPLAAARLRAGLTADCTELALDGESGDLLQTRPAIGGNILATIRTPRARPQMATVRPRSRAQAPEDESRRGTVVRVELPEACRLSPVRFEGFVPDRSQERPLEDADIIVAGGRGLKKGDNFSLVRDVARALGGEVGASRDAVDQGWIDYPHQIGLSGKTVAPRLYMACGISGSIQHLAGMQTAEVIVAVNRDPEAPIFNVADFAIVGDLFDVLPALRERLETRRRRP